MRRVLVIGAGLGGLAVAQGLRKAGIDVQVYEKDTDIEARWQGYRIGLREYGWSALRTCLPAELYDLAWATSGSLVGPGLLWDEQLTCWPAAIRSVRQRTPGCSTGTSFGTCSSGACRTGCTSGRNWPASTRPPPAYG
ncbi:NAD(P)-binding protein [Fodinicola feengrottensis]|uniref:NAD(P)-binding protein n=1 Tax=Fodinicola feengrottensis TaxID=435914 RepID=UPI0013D2AE33|nr:FAD/NAD(P)-binding protein [Fodinicola feengrottensis]